MFFGFFFAHTREAWTRRTSLLLENGMEYGGVVCGVRTLKGVRNVVGSGKYREGLEGLVGRGVRWWGWLRMRR
jgi:hypothetical protein